MNLRRNQLIGLFVLFLIVCAALLMVNSYLLTRFSFSVNMISVTIVLDIIGGAAPILAVTAFLATRKDAKPWVSLVRWAEAVIFAMIWSDIAIVTQTMIFGRSGGFTEPNSVTPPYLALFGMWMYWLAAAILVGLVFVTCWAVVRFKMPGAGAKPTA